MSEKNTVFNMLLAYHQKSINHVATAPEVSSEPGHWRAVAYRIGDHLLTSSFDQVIEITSLPTLTPVPCAKPWLLGVANARGTLLPIVDLKLFLLGERTLLQDGQKILVIQQSGGTVAVLVDELFGQRFFNDAQIVEDVSGFTGGRLSYFVNKAYAAAGKTWGVFDMRLLARTPEFRNAAA